MAASTNIQSITRDLFQAENGIWYSRTTDSVSYPSHGNAQCYAVEDESFWFAHRNECIATVVGAYPPPDGGVIYDIGGGNGFVSAKLKGLGYTVVLVEPGVQGALNARQRGIEHVICATTETAGFRPGSMPAIGLFDVIEHMENDVQFLREMHSLLQRDGKLYATVPAYSFLWSAEDVEAGHYRRYTLRSVRDLMEQTGFHIEYITYIFRFLPLAIFLFRTLPYRMNGKKYKPVREHTRKDHVASDGMFRKLFTRLLSSEIRALGKSKSITFGGSCLVVATRSKS